jgi:hypothetical protein
LESWLKNLSNEYIYAEQNPNRTRVTGLQNWPFRIQKRPTFSLKFWLWTQVPENWGKTRGFMLFLVLSWGIDYRKKSSETWFGRITSWNYVHPISHCGLTVRIKTSEKESFVTLTNLYKLMLAQYWNLWAKISVEEGQLDQRTPKL